MRIICLALALTLALPLRLFAAVGCDLNEPDRDVARLFPGSTGYQTRYLSIKDLGGKAMLERVEKRLGDKFQGLYETIDVPYTVYTVMKGQSVLGYIHGVNQKGVYGGIQVFLALDPAGVIKGFYFQKLTSRFGKQLRSPEFGKQFIGLGLKDFPPSGYPVIKNPVPEAEKDFRAALRGVKKNLILMDEFVFGRPK
ncbi:MAG: hypothetical protein NTY77_04190 [Elusimicrobia bacterium]|nr:hypothetical protein [Elusimicrobiota bacterium]